MIGNTNFGGVDVENIMENRSMTRTLNKTERLGGPVMNLAQGRLNTEYTIRDIKTDRKSVV